MIYHNMRHHRKMNEYDTTNIIDNALAIAMGGVILNRGMMITKYCKHLTYWL